MCSHGHAGGGGPCSASVVDLDHGDSILIYNLNAFIDRDKSTVLNERAEGSGVQIFKPWGQHKDKTHYVESDADEELLFNVSFTGHVKVSGITLIGDLDETHPSRVLIYKDIENMSFADVSTSRPIQEMALKQDDSALVDYPLIMNKFGDVTHLTLYFPGNFGADSTRIYYIGLRGEFQHEFRDRIVIANYESRPVPDDHKHEIADQVHHHIC